MPPDRPSRDAEQPLDVALRERPDAPLVVHVRGELDLGTAPRLISALTLAERRQSHGIVVDLADLHFVDATGLRVLLEAARRARDGGWRFEGRKPSPALRRLLHLIALDQAMTLTDG